MENFTPLSGFIGGLLIGLSAVLLILLNGKIAGISGIVGGLLARKGSQVGWRAVFIAGLLLGAFIYILATGGALPVYIQASLPVMIIAGFWWASGPVWVPAVPAGTALSASHVLASARSSPRWCSSSWRSSPCSLPTTLFKGG